MSINTATKNEFTNKNNINNFSNALTKRDNIQSQLFLNNINDLSSTIDSFPLITIYDNQNDFNNQNIIVISSNGYNKQQSKLQKQQQQQQKNIIYNNTQNNKFFNNQDFLTLNLNESKHLNNNNVGNNQQFINNIQQQKQQQQKSYLKKENLTEFPSSSNNQTDSSHFLTIPLMNSNLTYANNNNIKSINDYKNVSALSQKTDLNRLSTLTTNNKQITPQISPLINDESNNNNNYKFLSNELLLNNNKNNLNLTNNATISNHTNNDNLNTNNTIVNNQYNNSSTFPVRISRELFQSSNLSIAVRLYF